MACLDYYWKLVEVLCIFLTPPLIRFRLHNIKTTDKRAKVIEGPTPMKMYDLAVCLFPVLCAESAKFCGLILSCWEDPRVSVLEIHIQRKI